MRELTPDLRAFWTQQLATLSPTEYLVTLAVLRGHYGRDIEKQLKSRKAA